MANSLDGPIHILHIEDNPGDIRLTKEAFRSTAYETEIRSHSNGADALGDLTERASADDPSLPDLVLLDLGLPGESGHGVLERIRSDPQLEQLPVIVLSSSSNDEDISRSYRANANAYLTKPDCPDDFESLVDSIEQFWFEQVQQPPVGGR